MAHWQDAVVTNSGVEMLNEWMAGRFIKVTSAYGGTGIVSPETLVEQTGLINQKQRLRLLGEVNDVNGKTVQVQISNAEVREEYELNQVGVFAALDADKDPDAEERLLFIMQDENGVTVPSATDASFLLELYCLIGITNNGRFEVGVDAAGVVTAAYLRDVLAQAIAAHNSDETAHKGIRERLDCMADESAEVGQTVAGLETRLAQAEKTNASLAARVTLMELVYNTQVRGNPFTVTFENLEGLEVEGVWNVAQGRVEF